MLYNKKRTQKKKCSTIIIFNMRDIHVFRRGNSGFWEKAAKIIKLNTSKNFIKISIV